MLLRHLPTWLVFLESLRMALALPPLNSIAPVYEPPMLASASAAKSTTWGGSMMSPFSSSRGSVETTTLHTASVSMTDRLPLWMCHAALCKFR